MLFLHDPACAGYGRPGHPERPDRIRRTVPHLRERFPGVPWVVPGPAEEADLLRAHTSLHLQRLRLALDFDADTPFHEGIDGLARVSAGAAVEAARRALGGGRPFALQRPPGHHATRDTAMGFCYLNSIAVAALAAREAGAETVAIWDFDAHHGNGTEAIVRRREGIVFASVHQYPGYPGTGLATGGNVHNYPVAPGTDARHHMEMLESSWECLLEAEPDLILVSAGFDAFAGDPITELCLEAEDFRTLGSWCGGAPCPVAAILEGGYAGELPLLLEAFLGGWWGEGAS